MKSMSTDSKSRKPGVGRRERLKAALKVNLARRKAQARARRAAAEAGRDQEQDG